MPRPIADMQRRTVTIDTPKRSLDLPVDANGHLRRFVALDQHAVTRAADESASIGFKGHAAVFNRRTWIGSKQWGFAEIIMPGAFRKTLRESDTRMLHNHDPNMVCARSTNGTLRLAEDGVGLAVDADMNPVSYVRDLAMLLERGDVNQMSFGFEMVDWEWRIEDDGTELLIHHEVGPLWDVSTVTYPAYSETDASLRLDLLAAARAHGFDPTSIGVLAQRLAAPDDSVLAALRSIASVRSDEPPASEPAAVEPSAEPDTSVDDTSSVDDPAPEPDDRDHERDLAFADLALSMLDA